MKDLVIQGSHKDFFIPSVNFNASTGVCEISGESFLEDTVGFYKPILKWLEEFIETEKKSIIFVIKLTYFNTSTSRSLLDILNLLKKYEVEGGDIVIKWHYDPSDVDMEEDIEDYMIDTGVSITLIPND